MAAIVVFLVFLLRFTVFSTSAECNQGVHEISLTEIKSLIARVTDLEKGLQEERDRRMDLEREVAAMTKQNEDTINSLKLDFNNRIALILQKRIGDKVAVYTEDNRAKPTVVKPLFKQKDILLCANNQLKGLNRMLFSKFCKMSTKRQDGFESNEVERHGRLISVPANANIIAFSAYMSVTLPANHAAGMHVMVFDVVSINLGNGYHPTTGVYMVPETGVYIFTWSFRDHDGGYHSVELVKNTEVISVIYSKTVSGGQDQASGTAIVSSAKGDDVFIRTHRSYNSGEITSDELGRSYFAGWKLN